MAEGQTAQQVVDDYQAGMALQAVARRHTIPRSQVVRLLRQQGVALRSASAAHRLALANLSPQQRASKTQAARDAIAGRRPRGRRARAVLSWCGQAVDPEHQTLTALLRDQQINAQPYYPAGSFNVFVAVPEALLAIEQPPRRQTHSGSRELSDKIAYLLRHGWLVTFLTDDWGLHFESLLMLARMRSGLPVSLQHKAQVRQAMRPYLKGLTKGHAAAVAMAESLLQPRKSA